MRSLSTWGLAVVILMTSAASMAARGVQATDEEIAARVRHEMFDAGFVGVMVSVDRGEVSLAGTVPSIWAKQEAIKRTRKVRGVTQVTSTLEIIKGEGDALLANAVGHELRSSTLLSVFDLVNATVNNGVITLTGDVTLPVKSERLVDDLSRLEGAQDVVNQITVLPPSTTDDQIRFAVADRIYGSPSFLRYSLNVNPPIRILVNHGHVTLAGVVATEADKTTAGVLAGGVFGVYEVVNNLKVTS